MRYVNIFICLLMLLFMYVQHNDPDGALWIAIYAVPAICAALAAYNYRLLRGSVGRWLLPVCIGAAALATIYYWPKLPNWWKPNVWLEVVTGETAREGMGMMIVMLCLAMTWFGAKRQAEKSNDLIQR